MSGNVAVQSNLTCTNLTINGIIYDIFTLIGSTYLTVPGNIPLTASQTNGLGQAFFGLDLKNWFTFPAGISPVSRYITITDNGNVKFSITGVYKMTAVFATDQAIGRLAWGQASTDYAHDGRPTNSPYSYVYQFDVTQVPTISVTIPIVVTNINNFFYFDLISYRTTPTILYKTFISPVQDYGTDVGGTYVAIGPF
jgi:hypothetical protein